MQTDLYGGHFVSQHAMGSKKLHPVVFNNDHIFIQAIHNRFAAYIDWAQTIKKNCYLQCKINIPYSPEYKLPPPFFKPKK